MVFGDQLFDLGHHVAQRDAGAQRRLHRDHALAVLALDHRSGILLLHPADLLEFHGAAMRVVKRDVLHVIDRGAEWLAVAYDDVVFVAVLAVLRRHETVDPVFHGLRRSGAVHPVIRQAVAVEDHVVFGAQVVARKFHVAHAFHPAHLLLQVVGDGVRDVHIIAENLDIDRRRAAHAARHAARRHRVLTHFGNPVEVFAQQVGNDVDRTLAPLDIRQTHVVVDNMRAGGLHRGEGVVRRVGSGRSRHQHDLRIFRIDDAVDLPGDARRILHADILLQLDHRRDTAVVRRREELGRHAGDQSQRNDEKAHHREDRDAAVADHPVQ